MLFYSGVDVEMGQPLRRQAFDHGDEDGMNHGSRSQDKDCFSNK